MPMNGDDVQILFKKHQRQHGAYAAEGREMIVTANGPRLSLQNSENDVHRQRAVSKSPEAGAKRIAGRPASVPAKKPCSVEGVPSRFCIG